jgi:hypothetical protein
MEEGLWNWHPTVARPVERAPAAADLLHCPWLLVCVKHVIKVVSVEWAHLASGDHSALTTFVDGVHPPFKIQLRGGRGQGKMQDGPVREGQLELELPFGYTRERERVGWLDVLRQPQNRD